MTRTSQEIGAGLAAARDARPIPAGQRIHVIGAAGAGASAAALLGQRAGATVTGCDAGGPSPYTVALEAAGIPVAWSHGADHVAIDGRPVVDRVAVTKALTSVDPDQPELAAARSAGLSLESWQQLVADAATTTGQRLVAVAGTHGKSTSAGWLVHLLVRAGRDPSAFVGALLPAAITGGRPATARWGSGSDFVVEADEYAGNFDAFRPSVALLLNADWDHPDVFADEDAVVDAFAAWLDGPGAADRTVIVNVGDGGARRVIERLRTAPKRLVTTALSPGRADVIGIDHGGSMTVTGLGAAHDVTIRTTLGLAGRHNAANALLVAVAASELGVESQLIAEGLATFTGVGRRLELKGEPSGIAVLDDYAHHPTAIAATLEAVRATYPGRPVWAVYEPLTYHRTAAFLDVFATVLATADHAVIADIWAGRDPDTTISSAAALADAVSRRSREPATAPGSVEATADHLLERVRPGDVVLVMGGGRSYVIAERLVAGLAERAASGR